jgi:hypothetical protein
VSLSDAEKRARLQRALDYGGNTHEIHHVVERCHDGRAQFWSNGDGTIITELEEYPLYKVVRYWLIAGELRHCLALEHVVNPWAIEAGCTRAVAAGRPGWGRVAASTGWRQHMPTFYKPLVRSV